MARSLNIAQRTYSPTIRSFTVNTFPVDVEYLEVRFTRVNWPGTTKDTVMKIKVMWNDGSGVEFGLPGGEVFGKNELTETSSVVRVRVPRETDPNTKMIRRKSVVSGTITVEILQALTTSFFIEAI